MPDQVLQYFRKHKQFIEDNLQLCEDPHDIEAIHNLRLSVKRIRVVVRIAAMINPESFIVADQLREINKLFKRSGRLRDIQVTRQLLIDFQNPLLDPVIAQFDHRETKQRKKFEKALKKFDYTLLEDLEKSLLKVFNGVSSEAVLQAGYLLLSEMEFDVHKIFHSSLKEKRLHDIRTRIKDMNYLNNIFENRLPVADQLNISIERLKEVGEIAGAWHDCLNLEKKLGKFIRKLAEDSESGSLQGIVAELVIKKQGLSQEYSCILMNEMKV